MALWNFKEQTSPAAPSAAYQSSGREASAVETRTVVIAVDGPAASGKGTLARKIADQLGYAYLDTGTLYRAVGLATLEMGGDPANADDVLPALAIVRRHMTPELLSNRALRTPDVASAASKVAALPQVRAELLAYQRDFAAAPPNGEPGAVLDGRDIGTAVCPDADVKLFVTAAPEERARRRWNEQKNFYPGLTPESVLADIVQRDARDSTRTAAPTTQAADAHLIDTTALAPDAVLLEAIRVVHAAFLRESGK